MNVLHRLQELSLSLLCWCMFCTEVKPPKFIKPEAFLTAVSKCVTESWHVCTGSLSSFHTAHNFAKQQNELGFLKIIFILPDISNISKLWSSNLIFFPYLDDHLSFIGNIISTTKSPWQLLREPMTSGLSNLQFYERCDFPLWVILIWCAAKVRITRFQPAAKAEGTTLLTSLKEFHASILEPSRSCL